MSFNYHNPVSVRFGVGVVDELPRLLGGRAAVLVTYPEARASGLRARLEALLGPVLRDVIDDIEPNPEAGWFRERYSKFSHSHRDCVLVAVGGGSVIDTAKVLQIGVRDDDFDEYFASLEKGKQPDATHVRALIAIPTTAGTGSEVTPWATLWDRGSSTPKKYSLQVRNVWPEAALVDPALTLSAPMQVARNSALDALSHALESIWNVNHNPISDALAVTAARGVIDTLPALLEQPDDLSLRVALSRASLMAGLAFSNTRTALAHSISYEMTLRHGLPHGLACSFTLPMVWRLAAGADAERDAVLGRVFPEAKPTAAPRAPKPTDSPDAPDAPAMLERFLRGVAVGTRFDDYGVSDHEARAMVTEALDGVRGKNFINAAPVLSRVSL